MGDSSQEKQLLYSDPPPSYEESQKHEKVQDILVAPPAPPFQTEHSQNSHLCRSQHPFTQEKMQVQMNVYPRQQTFIPDAFEAGARFTCTSPPSIPPPPPGVAPNAAQIAAQQGLHVFTTKKKSSFW